MHSFTGGGCPTLGGQNCLAIPGALNVACIASECEVCESGAALTVFGRALLTPLAHSFVLPGLEVPPSLRTLRSHGGLSVRV